MQQITTIPANQPLSLIEAIKYFGYEKAPLHLTSNRDRVIFKVGEGYKVKYK